MRSSACFNASAGRSISGELSNHAKGLMKSGWYGLEGVERWHSQLVFMTYAFVSSKFCRPLGNFHNLLGGENLNKNSSRIEGQGCLGNSKLNIESDMHCEARISQVTTSPFATRPCGNGIGCLHAARIENLPGRIEQKISTKDPKPLTINSQATECSYLGVGHMFKVKHRGFF